MPLQNSNRAAIIQASATRSITYTTVTRAFENAKASGRPTNVLADELAEYNLKNGIGRRKTPIKF